MQSASGTQLQSAPDSHVCVHDAPPHSALHVEPDSHVMAHSAPEHLIEQVESASQTMSQIAPLQDIEHVCPEAHVHVSLPVHVIWTNPAPPAPPVPLPDDTVQSSEHPTQPTTPNARKQDFKLIIERRPLHAASRPARPSGRYHSLPCSERRAP